MSPLQRALCITADPASTAGRKANQSQDHRTTADCTKQQTFFSPTLHHPVRRQSQSSLVPDRSKDLLPAFSFSNNLPPKIPQINSLDKTRRQTIRFGQRFSHHRQDFTFRLTTSRPTSSIVEFDYHSFPRYVLNLLLTRTLGFLKVRSLAFRPMLSLHPVAVFFGLCERRL